MFILLKYLLYGYDTYIWQDVIFVKETPKAILIEFDDRQTWIPKVWILKIKSPLPKEERARRRLNSIKISQYHWSKKFV